MPQATTTTKARLQRALELDVLPLGRNAFRVTGGSRPEGYRVAVTADGITCSCPDGTWRDEQSMCKHAVAVVIHVGGPLAREDAEEAAR